jgi:hypothetical protein
VCRLFRTVDEQPPGKWHRRVVTGSWKRSDGTAIGCRGDMGQAPHLGHVVDRPADVFLTLTLDSFDHDDEPSIALFLLAPSSNPYVSGGRKRVKRRTTTNGVASSSPFTNLSTVSVSAPNLGVQEEGYTIVPLSYDAGSEAEWTISVFCERSFGLSALP